MARQKKEIMIPLYRLEREVYQAIREMRELSYSTILWHLKEQIGFYEAELERDDNMHKARMPQRDRALEQTIKEAFETMSERRAPVPAGEAWREEQRLKGNTPAWNEQPPASWLKKYTD
ncbi:MAG: hypothetical protein RJS97_02850 [Parvibaculaceae bacterium]